MRAAAYCRVSTDQRDQLHSFESQKQYFKSYIEGRTGWTLAGIYADEGITGTSTAGRAGFLEMIDDAHRGLFDVILTKEVSRFSRNILDAVSYTRALKKIGVAVVFLSDGISTFDPDAELRLGIMASVAQEESRKTSERVKWGQQRKMERGVVFGRSLLGYEVKSGCLSVEPTGAETVRAIFSLFLNERMGVRAIAGELTRRGLETPLGGQIWSGATVLKILRNEKYCGDLRQRKTITTDFLTHKKEVNRGSVEFIFFRDHHEPIVSRPDWDAVQSELTRRASRGDGAPCGSRYALSGRIICGRCRVIYLCRTKKRTDGTAYRVWTHSRCACGGGRRQLREDAVDRCIRRFISGLDASTLLNSFAEILARVIPCREDDIAALRQDISRVVNKSAKLADAYFEGDIEREIYRVLMEKYIAEINKLNCLLVEHSNDIQPKRGTELDALVRGAVSGVADVGSFYLDLAEQIEVRPDGSLEIMLRGLSGGLIAEYK